MSDLLFARSQMALSLVFHIIFAAIGIGLPVLMVIAEAMYLRTHRPVYLELAKRWAHVGVISSAGFVALVNSSIFHDAPIV